MANVNHGAKVAEDIKVILVRKSLNLAKLADLMGVSSTTLYSKFKRGNFTLKDLDDIAEALDITYNVDFNLNEE